MLALPAARAQDMGDARAESAAAAVARHLGVFLTVPERREAGEGVRVVGERIEIWFLRPTRRAEEEQAVCDGARWLTAGRLAGVSGIRALFEAQAGVEEVSLVFYDLHTQVKPDAEGRYIQTRTVVAQARFTITRAKAGRLDPAALRKTLVGARCAHVGRTLLDEVRLE